MSEVERYLIQKTPIGTMMKPNPEGNWVASEDFDRVAAERDALQQRLTAADDRADVLTKALTDGREALGREYWDQYAGLDETRDILDAALKSAEAVPDFRMIGIEKMPPMEFDEP